MLDKKSPLWQYLSSGQRSLIAQGLYLVNDAKTHTPVEQVTDYSYLVFPFAKAYEGFLKQLFLDMELIDKVQYESDHFRIGKVLSPHLVQKLRDDSLFKKLTALTGNSDLAQTLWKSWKEGRNLIFHYFPHNTRAITLIEAELLNRGILKAMELGVAEYKKLNSQIQ